VSLALCVAAAALFINGTFPAFAVSPGNRIPWQGSSSYLNGADYPWVHYGNDFGGNAWGAYGVHDPGTRAAVDADFARMERQGIRLARWWLFADGRAGIVWDAGGMPKGLDQYVFADLDTALALAQQHHIYLELVLTDVSLLYKAATVNGVQTGGRPYLVNTPAGQQALLANVFNPIFQRYGHHPQVLAYEVMNEPEWAITEDRALNAGVVQPASLASFQSLVRQVAASVHSRTHSYVSVGSAASRWVRQWKGLGLDFYSVHYYDWMHPLADSDLYDSGCSALHLDAPVMVGEYPAGGGTASFRKYLDNWLAGGCAGALVWSFRGVDSVGQPDPDVMETWNAAHTGSSPPGLTGPGASAVPGPSSTPAQSRPPSQPQTPPTPSQTSPTGPPGDVRYDFEDGTRGGWSVSWGVGITLRNGTVPHDFDQRGLEVRLTPATGWPAIAVSTGLEGLVTGKTLTYQLWAPRGVRPTVTPYAVDRGLQEHDAPTVTLQPGWNTIEWQVPEVDGVTAIGLQFNNPDAWGGRFYLDEVNW
jgi:hypothetical protein